MRFHEYAKMPALWCALLSLAACSADATPSACVAPAPPSLVPLVLVTPLAMPVATASQAPAETPEALARDLVAALKADDLKAFLALATDDADLAEAGAAAAGPPGFELPSDVLSARLAEMRQKGVRNVKDGWDLLQADAHARHIVWRDVTLARVDWNLRQESNVEIADLDLWILHGGTRMRISVGGCLRSKRGWRAAGALTLTVLKDALPPACEAVLRGYSRCLRVMIGDQAEAVDTAVDSMRATWQSRDATAVESECRSVANTAKAALSDRCPGVAWD